MAKMFYSLEEAAKKLRKSADEVRQMAAKKQITEFRDGDRLIFKVDQIDLLAGDGDAEASDMSSMIPLTDTGGGTAIGMDVSGASGSGERDAKQRSGISVFDIEGDGSADPSAATVAGSGFGEALNVEALGSGSGLMDMARESDDTSLGAEGLLDELYPGGGDSGATAAAPTGGGAGDSGLFERAPGEAAGLGGGLGGGGVPMFAGPVEIYDGKGSGLVGGLSFGAVIALLAAVAVVLMGMMGAAPTFLATFLGGNVLIMTGILLGVVLIGAGLGFFLGSKTSEA